MISCQGTAESSGNHFLPRLLLTARAPKDWKVVENLWHWASVTSTGVWSHRDVGMENWEPLFWRKKWQDVGQTGYSKLALRFLSKDSRIVVTRKKKRWGVEIIGRALSLYRQLCYKALRQYNYVSWLWGLRRKILVINITSSTQHESIFFL